MAVKLLLKGVVQGVFCRNYCSKYGKKLGVRGSATNLPDGSVRVLLDTEDKSIVDNYIYHLMNNPMRLMFYGRIDNVETIEYYGKIHGDYFF